METNDVGFYELELLARSKKMRLAIFIARELASEDIEPSWRNSLIFATEHMDCKDPTDRQHLRDLLPGLVKSMNPEWQSRPNPQVAALRRYISLLEDNTELNSLCPFLSTEYSVRLRRVALLGIQNAFSEVPPTASVLKKLKPLRKELCEIARYLLRPSALDQAQPDFFLGLDALDALIRLGDPHCAEFVRQATSSGRRWVSKQIKRMLEETHCAWKSQSSVQNANCLDALVLALNALKPSPVESD